MQVTINMVGTRPLIQHNKRLANPLDPHTRRLKELMAQRKKTDELLARIAHAEMRGGYYETVDGYIGVETEAVFATLKTAAKTMKLGKQIEKALRFELVTEPLIIDGRYQKPEEHMKPEQSLLYVPVRVKNNRIMRARPIFHEWSCTHRFELKEQLLNLGELKQIVEVAGTDIGLLEWRPRFGTFNATVSNGEVKKGGRKK